MDSSIAEELLRQASHGGRNQRARAQEQLLQLTQSTSVGNLAASTSDHPTGSSSDRPTPSGRFDSEIADLVIREWAWGLLSANKVQKMAATSLADQQSLLARLKISRDFLPQGLVALAGIADKGRYPGNAHRDLVRYLGEPMRPKPFRASIHVKVLKPVPGRGRVQPVACSFLLPHEFFHYHYTHRYPEFVEKFLGGHEDKVEEFWRGVVTSKDLCLKYHPMVSDKPNWLRKAVPVSFHGDAVPCLAVGKAGTKSLDVTSWQATLSSVGSSLLLKN